MVYTVNYDFIINKSTDNLTDKESANIQHIDLGCIIGDV